MQISVLISHGGGLQIPAVTEGCSIEWEREGQPGKLKFSVLKDKGLDFAEGDAVRADADGVPVFYGFVFEKSRRGSSREVIDVVAYDQLYYLKNKDTYVYTGKSAGDLVRMIAEDFGLRTGEIADTGYVIPSRVEDNQTLFDIIGNALDLTLDATGEMYVLYDDAGSLTLRRIGDMRLNMLIDEETAGEYSYATSITGTYNKVKLIRENTETGTREVYIAQDSSHIAEWGVLQYAAKVNGETNAQVMAGAILELYNTKTRTLRLTNVLGDIRVRGGTTLAVMLDLGDMQVASYLMVESVKHVFKGDMHTMDLRLRGGTFVT